MSAEFGTRKDRRRYPKLSRSPLPPLSDEDFQLAYCNEGFVHRVSPAVAEGLIRAGRFQRVNARHIQQVSKGLCILTGRFGHQFAGRPRFGPEEVP